MNTIKFNKIDNPTTEQHDFRLEQIQGATIFGHSFQMAVPCNLNIFITNACPNRCDFCINKDYIGSDIADDDYTMSLLDVVREVHDLPIEITLTGGEPTLNKKRFVDTMYLCNLVGLPCRTVSTVGTNLMEDYNGLPLYQWMIMYGFTHNINISRMAVNDDENYCIFHNENITNENIATLAEIFNLNDAEMRVSCNLIPGHVDSAKKMLDFVDFYRSIGVETIMFRELEGVSDRITIGDLSVGAGTFEYVETMYGMLYKVDVYYYKDMVVKHYISYPTPDPRILYSMSLRNGRLCKGFGQIIKMLHY